MKNTVTVQLELTMNKDRAALRNNREEGRRRQAWWFQKMRKVVDLAVRQEGQGFVRPEQTYLRLASNTPRIMVVERP